MPRVRIRIDGSTDTTSRLRIKQMVDRAGAAGSAASRGTVAGGVSAKALLVVLAVAGVVYSNSSASKPAVLVDGKVLQGDRVLVLRDVSGSMGNLQGRLESRVAELQAAGLTIDLVADVGGSSVDSFVVSLGQVLPDLPQVDTVYFFADFEDPGSAELYNQLRRLLDGRGLKLYIATVNFEPAREWVEIVGASGGDLLDSRR